MFKRPTEFREKSPKKPTDGYPWALALVCIAMLARAAFAQPMAANEAAPIYANLFGKSYNPQSLPILYAANQLIEQYFTSLLPQRSAIVQQIQATKLDPGVIGRLIHVRLGWQALQPGVYYINERSGPFTLKYFLGVPKGYRRDIEWPLVVRLATPNAFVTDPPPGKDQIAQIYSNWITEELASHPDALVLMPLLDLRELWGPSYQGMNNVIQPMLNAAGKVNVDPNRVYLVGYSMAAHAVWNISLHYATYFAAINPLAGGAAADWQRLRLPNLRNVYPVVWADTDDKIVPFAQSKQLVDILRRIKIDLDYTQTTGLGHAPSPQIIEDTYKKMRARVRQSYPAHNTIESDRPDSIFNRNDWVQVYQELTSGQDVLEYLSRGTGPLRMVQNSFGVEATISNNTVNISADNVETLRLYFNDQMVDLTKPITVIANYRQRFQGIVPINLDDMMKDQIFLGRGWRYYTATLDIDLTGNSGPLISPPPTTKPGASATSRPRGRITVYNEDGTVNRVIESGGSGN